MVTKSAFSFEDEEDPFAALVSDSVPSPAPAPAPNPSPALPSVIPAFASPPPAAAGGRPSGASRASSGNGTSHFGTPLSRLSKSSTGGGSLATSKEKLVKLLFVGSSNQVCGGVIGKSSNQRFCIVDAAACAVESHKVKCNVESQCAYIRHHRVNQAWISPCLPASCVDASKLEELLKEEDTVARFKTQIADLRGREKLMVETVSDADSSYDLLDSPPVSLSSETPTAEEVRRAERDVATPRSLKSVSSMIPKTILEKEPVDVADLDKEPDIWNDKINSIQELSDIPTVDGVPVNFDDASMAVISDWGKLKDNLGFISDRLENLKEGKEFLRVQVRTGLEMIDDKMRTVDTKIQLLHQAIGSNPEASDDGAKSLWNVIGEIQEAHQFNEIRLENLAKMLNNAEGTGLAARTEELAADLKDLSRSVEDSVTNSNKMKMTMVDRFITLKRVLSGVFERLKELESSEVENPSRNSIFGEGEARSGPANRSLSNLQSQIDEMKKRYKAVEEYLKNLDALDPSTELPRMKAELKNIMKLLKRKRSSKSKQAKARKRHKNSRKTSTPPSQRWEGGFGSFEDMMRRHESQDNDAMDCSNNDSEPSYGDFSSSESSDDDVEDSKASSASSSSTLSMALIEEQVKVELEQIKSKLLALEAPEDAQGYEEGGYSFPTQNDLALFMDKHDVEPAFCWDWYSALIGMGAKNQRGKERGEEVLLEHRTGVNFMEHELTAAMDYVMPPAFFAANGRGQVNDREDGFAACPTYSDWIGSSGKRKPFHQKITDELNSFLGSINGNYRGKSGEPADFIRHLTSRITVQWSQIQTFFNDSYIKLRSQAKFSEKASWTLIGRYGAAMFEAMNKYRHVASRLHKPSSRSARVTLVWAVLQSHRVLNEFIRVQFASHPAIVKEISFFTLMERVDPGEVRKLEQEVDKLRGEIKDLKKAKELANNANNTITQLKTNYEKLEKRLKKVEDKVA